VIDFHHVNREKKERDVSEWVRCASYKKFYEEIKKCILLCSNCHRKLHAGQFELTEEQKRIAA
jgi:hypothetical protein